ncbi:AaceriAER141Cp [[Ashbya] aceris (nom. inval.)]|nr:AaceriAER141Cp [[Ashbya] aceris (nom. inval.)]
MVGIYDSKRRTKPCSNCKQTKVKCEYIQALPCTRCTRNGLECYFPDRSGGTGSSDLEATVVPCIEGSEVDPQWMRGINDRLTTFESALESMLAVVQTGQIQQQQQINLLQQQMSQQQQLPDISQLLVPTILDSSGLIKQYTDVRDFRSENVISRQQAAELLELFVSRYAGHLFGYLLSDLSIDELWANSPILLAAICTVTCRQQQQVAHLAPQLRQSLDWFTTRLAGTSRRPSKNEEMEHILLGLLIAALWLHSNQLYISVVLHLARVWRIDQLCTALDADDRLTKIWYLLYILDGNELLVSNRRPILYHTMEPSLSRMRDWYLSRVDDKTVREVLVATDTRGINLVNHRQLQLLNEVGREKVNTSSTILQEMRLLSQVEFHTAIESIFHSDNSVSQSALPAGLSLLEPSNFGVPWKHNMDIDRWMISWTIALQEINVQQDAWSLKSTLLYYHFARMYINAKSSIDVSKDKLFAGSAEPAVDETKRGQLHDSSHQIAHSAAHSILRLVTRDKDVRSIFQFLPLHMYIMVFYASVILLDPTYTRHATGSGAETSMKEAFLLVSRFKHMLGTIASSDLEFQNKLVNQLQHHLVNFNEACSSYPNCGKRIQEILNDAQSHVEQGLDENESKIKHIVAWPGTNHGHP